MGDVFGDAAWRDNKMAKSAVHVRALTYCDIHMERETCMRTSNLSLFDDSLTDSDIQGCSPYRKIMSATSTPRQ